MSANEYERWAELADREAVGDDLTDEERDFCRRFEQDNPACRAELGVWAQLRDLEANRDDIGARSLANSALQATEPERGAPTAASPVRRFGPWVAAGGLAVAAGAALWMTRSPDTGPVAESDSVVSDMERPGFTLSHVSGNVLVNGVDARAGTTGSDGSTVTVGGGGVACVEIDPSIDVCADGGSKIEISGIGSAARRVELVEGRVAAALAPQRNGRKFSIVANDTWVTAVGTAFSVELGEGTVRTIVYEGKVSVGDERGGRIVEAHKIGLSSDQGVDVSALKKPERTPMWTALEAVSGKMLVEAPPAPVVDESALAEAEESGPETAEAARKSGPSSQSVELAEDAATSADLLGRARKLMREQQWAAAADAYRALRRAHPTSAEAHTVLVSLGELELSRLGQPVRALRSFDTYLKSGGSLAIEAHLGRIRALRQLGEGGREAQAIRDFLAKHPKNLQADSLRRRLESLERP